MDLPTTLSEELRERFIARDAPALLGRLEEVDTALLVEFFAAALQDERYCAKERFFMTRLIHLICQRFLQGLLRGEHAVRAANALRARYSSVHRWIPQDIRLRVEGETIPVNALLYGTASGQIARQLPLGSGYREAEEVLPDAGIVRVELPDVPQKLLRLLREWVEQAKMPNIVRLGKKEVLDLLHAAVELEIYPFLEQATPLLHTLLEEATLQPLLELAYEALQPNLTELCVAWMNERFYLGHLSVYEHATLSVTLQAFSERVQQKLAPAVPVLRQVVWRNSLAPESEAWRWLASLPNLHALDLSGTRLVDPASLGQLSPLEQLILRDCAWVNRRNLGAIVNLQPSLRFLDLGDNSALGLQDLAPLQELNRLNHLSLSSTSLSGEELGELLLGLPDLQHLDLSRAEPAQLEGLQHVGKLEEMVLDHSHHLPLELVGEVVRGANELKILSLRNHPELTPYGVDQIKRLCPSLLEVRT